MRALALLVVMSPALAHADFEEKGVRAGGVLFEVSRDDGGQQQIRSEAVNSRPGWMAGVWLTWRKTENFAIQLEGALSNKLLRSEMCSPCMTTGDISLYYLEVPFLLRLDLLPNETKFHLDAGAEAVLTLGGGSTSPDGTYTRFEDLLPFNLGPVIGLGLEIPAGPGKIALDVRYKRWLVPLTGAIQGEPPAGFGTPERDIEPSHQVMLSMGYAFP